LLLIIPGFLERGVSWCDSFNLGCPHGSCLWACCLSWWSSVHSTDAGRLLLLVRLGLSCFGAFPGLTQTDDSDLPVHLLLQLLSLQQAFSLVLGIEQSLLLSESLSAGGHTLAVAWSHRFDRLGSLLISGESVVQIVAQFL
jgi:hypothetical protein